jgi:trk system potassium uptake protein TrkH
MLLIHVGGLGIVTFSTFFALILGRRVGMSQFDLVRDTLSPVRVVGIFSVVRRVFFYTILFEALGASILFFRWLDEYGFPMSAFHAAFHAISAFCNAGFSTLPRSLMDYVGDPTVNLVIMGLIVTGGIGFLVIIDLELWLRRRKRLALHSKLVLFVSAFLIVTGAILFYVLELNNGLKNLPFHTKLLAALFQSVTPRTAGFNTLDYGLFTGPTLFMIILLMVVGGSPASTAGGIKTSTLGVLAALARAKYRGRERVDIFRRSVPDENVNQAISVLVISAITLIVLSFLLLVTEGGLRPLTREKVDFLQIAFEATSAFGTVGLSTGITPSLTPPGKLLIMLLMYVGRVGPLTIVLAVAQRERRGRFQYAEEGVVIS